MRILSAMVVALAVSLPIAGEAETLHLPGLVAVFEDGGLPVSLGFAFKAYEIAETPIGLGSFELRGMYAFDTALYRMDLVWPSLFGLVAPGFSVDYDGARFTPWFYAEFYPWLFPFAFAFFMAADDDPIMIPSAFVALRVGEAGIRGDLGIALSFPLGGGKRPR